MRSKVSLLAYKCFEEILLFLPLQRMKFRSKRFCYVFLNKTECYLYQMLSESSQILYRLQLYTRLSAPWVQRLIHLCTTLISWIQFVEYRNSWTNLPPGIAKMGSPLIWQLKDKVHFLKLLTKGQFKMELYILFF